MDHWYFSSILLRFGAFGRDAGGIKRSRPKSGSALVTSDQSWRPCRRKLLFAFFGRGEGTSSEWALELDNASIEEAWLRTAAPQARRSLPCASNQRPAPLMRCSRANSARLEDKPTQASAE
ncbi:hypothetical protein [Alkalicoccus urumqiensis]|uniref:hypothetical protein n=1 Tax=Alkalicoccus urumqiensis TaxID=1548213 RepID=UPI001158CCAE|nr:hypothetical protein [Alkalicoccus urumqiensis]